MITKQQVLDSTNTEFHYTGHHMCTRTVGPRGGVTENITRVRRNGSVQTWVTRPADFRLPVKVGTYGYDAILNSDASDWHTALDCPLVGHTSFGTIQS